MKAKTVYKYPFSISDEFALLMPRYADLLSVQVQRDTPCIWALVDPTQPNVTRKFRLVGTGHEIQPEEGHWHDYVGTFQLSGGLFVGHLFEVIRQVTEEELAAKMVALANQPRPQS